MTVNVETPYASATVVEGITDYSFDFTIQDETELVVQDTVSGQQPVTLVLNSDYSVTLNGSGPNPGWGFITLLIAQPIGSLLEQGRNMPFDQAIEWANYGDLPMDLIERSFDKTALIDQQLQDGVDRSLKIPPGSGVIDYTLPPPVADSVIAKWNATADGLLIGPKVSDIENAENYANQAAAAASESSDAANAAADSAVEAEQAADSVPSTTDPWTWNAVQNYAANSLSIIGGSVAWTINTIPSAVLTLTEDIILSKPDIILDTKLTTKDTTWCVLRVTNQGSYLISFDEAFKFGFIGMIQPAPNGTTIYTFTSDGDNFWFMSAYRDN